MKTIKFKIDPKNLSDYMIKERAQNLVRSSVQKGELIRPTQCQLCKIEHKNIQGHHTNYGNPLDVVWVCAACHNNIHNTPDHPLNPKNVQQTEYIDFKVKATTAEIKITIPLELYAAIKKRSEKNGVSIFDEINTNLRRSYPTRNDIRCENDESREEYFERISSLVEDEAELPKQELSRVSKSRSIRHHNRSTMDRFYSVSTRHAGDAEGVQCAH